MNLFKLPFYKYNMAYNLAVLKKVGVLSAAKVYGLIGAIIGLFVGIIFAIMAAIFGAVAGAVIPGAGGTFAGFGLLSIIIMPIILGAIMFIMGAVGAIIYNLVAGWVGGVELELDEIEIKKK